MKKVKIITFILCIVYTSGFAQIKENAVKVNLQNFAFGSLSLGYEHALNKKNSLNIGLGIPIGQNLSTGQTGDLYSDGYVPEKATLSNFHIRTAYRHYTGKKEVPKGFYYEPYLKYQTLSPKIDGISVSDKKASIDGKLSSFTGGLQLGYQFLIAKTVVLDFYFFGLEAGFASFKMTGTTEGDLEQYKKDIESNITDLPIIGDKTKVKIVDNKVDVRTSSIFFPSFRAGLSLGIAF